MSPTPRNVSDPSLGKMGVFYMRYDTELRLGTKWYLSYSLGAVERYSRRE